MAFSFFFRDLPVLEHAADHLVQFSSGRMKVRVWDAGSALGQETYTLAILLAERMGNFAFRNLRIDATDYDRANKFGEVVTRAVYPYHDLKRMPSELFSKYFEADETTGDYHVIDKLRSQVRFQYHDLLSFSPIGEGYSLIVCKNVLLHFSAEQRIRVIEMFHGALLPGGYFTTEQTQQMPRETTHLFEQVVSDSRLYRKIGDT